MSMANTPRTEMNTFSSLSPGDHITQQRPLGYWHHAIVLSVTSADIITVIHYSQADEGRLFGEIRLQVRPLKHLVTICCMGRVQFW